MHDLIYIIGLITVTLIVISWITSEEGKLFCSTILLLGTMIGLVFLIGTFVYLLVTEPSTINDYLDKITSNYYVQILTALFLIIFSLLIIVGRIFTKLGRTPPLFITKLLRFFE